VQDISFKLENTPGLEVKPSFFFMRLFLNDCLEYCLKATAAANSKQEKARKFFEVINEVFTKTEVSKELSQIKPVPQLIKELATLILNRDIKEISARDEDVPLQGLFSLLKNIL
jgi:DNA-binding FrmR family transcriptional regulator